MSGIEWWIGPAEAVVEALSAVGIAPDRVRFITEASLDAVNVARWCGIDALPKDAHIFTLHASEEADGAAEWQEYRPRSFAPRCEVVAARVQPPDDESPRPQPEG